MDSEHTSHSFSVVRAFPVVVYDGVVGITGLAPRFCLELTSYKAVDLPTLRNSESPSAIVPVAHAGGKLPQVLRLGWWERAAASHNSSFGSDISWLGYPKSFSVIGSFVPL